MQGFFLSPIDFTFSEVLDVSSLLLLAVHFLGCSSMVFDGWGELTPLLSPKKNAEIFYLPQHDKIRKS